MNPCNIKNPGGHFIGLLSLSVLGILFVAFFPFLWGVSSPMVRFIDTFYMMSPNYCQYTQIKGINILGYVYGVVIIFSFLCVLWKIRKGRSPWKQGVRILYITTFVMVFVIAFFQIKFQIRQFAYEYKYFKGSDTTGKYEKIYKETFGFAKYCHSNVSGKKRAVMNSDLNLEKGEGFFRKTELSYFLYPITILGQYYDAPDVIIMYKKQNPLRSLPSGFLAFPPYDCDSLIAARGERL